MTVMTQSLYRVRRVLKAPPLNGAIDYAAWGEAEVAEIVHFHSESSDHRPLTTARVLHDNENLYVLFNVCDRYVRCVNTQYQGRVCWDSCVEFFVQPKEDKGYFNFEVNCGGAMMLMYIEDPTYEGEQFRRAVPVTARDAASIVTYPTLPRVIEPEIAEPLEWRMGLKVPLAVLENYVGALGDIGGQRWRANFFKCGDRTSHPHWASWSPINGQLNFHQPRFFGDLVFESR